MASFLIMTLPQRTKEKELDITRRKKAPEHTKAMLRRLFGLSASSGLSVFFTALLSLILGKLLPIDEFGVTRTITAYLVLLTMFGNLTLHDALAYFVARSNKAEISQFFFHATALVILASSLVAVMAMLIFGLSGYWSGPLRIALLVVTFTLPALNLAILYNSSLQALGSHRTFALVTALSALIPLLVLAPFSAAWALNGWISGRCIIALLLLFISWYAIRSYLACMPIKRRYLIQLFAFSRLQFLSGILSLVLMSADVILLERLTNDLAATANYGMAQLFAKSVLFLPTAIGRAYFKDIATADNRIKKIAEFLCINITLGLVIGLGLWIAGPALIEHMYGHKYLLATQLIKIMALGIVFSFLWNCISTINVATGKPAISALISSIGATFGLILLLTGIPVRGAVGAAWAMNIAYAAGAMAGLYFVYRNIYEKTPRAIS